MQKAQLRYNEKQYFKEDLLKVCESVAKKNKAKVSAYKLDRSFSRMVIQLNRDNQFAVAYVDFDDLDKWLGSEEDMSKKKKNNNYSMKYAIQYEGKGYLPEELMDIGNDLASIWGGFCIGYKIDKDTERIDFNCVEHCEEFSTDLAFYQLNSAEYSKYGTKLK